MTSEKQVLANRRNAQKSTGAKTPEGKASVRFNAMKHGLLAQDVLLPGEDETALKELGKLLRDELQPVGGMENLLVDRIVDAYWRLRRLGRVEAGMFTWEQYEELAERAANEARSYLQMIYKTEEERRLKTPHVMDEQKYDEAYERAQEMKAKQEEETAMLGGAFIRDADKANAFSKLSRYETSIERSLYKALHELQRLQAARRAEGNVPPPVAVDVDVSGVSQRYS
jgi:hypothetical protein